MATAARIPSSVFVGGMQISVTTTSGVEATTAASNWSWSAASPTTVMSLWSLSSARTPSRTSKLSSATTARRLTNSYHTRESVDDRRGEVDGQAYDRSADAAAESIRLVDPALLLRL